MVYVIWHITLLYVQWKNSWWWTEELSETCRVLFQKWIWEISVSGWFYHKNLSRCMVTWTSKYYIFNVIVVEYNLYVKLKNLSFPDIQALVSFSLFNVKTLELHLSVFRYTLYTALGVICYYVFKTNRKITQCWKRERVCVARDAKRRWILVHSG